MAENKNLLEWIEAFDNGEYDQPDFYTQVKAGWFDWFCKDSSLRNKTKKLGSNLKQIINSPKLDPKNQYVFFKNNCPMAGELYDDFRICCIKTGDVIYTIIPRSGHYSENGNGSVWGRDNDFNGPLFTGTWKEIKDWFDPGKKIREFLKNK